MITSLPTRRAWRMWQRNAASFRSVWIGNVLGNVADPVLYLLVFGLGVGALMRPLDGRPYVEFLAGGLIAAAAMMSACFEGSLGAYIRMREQRTFEAVLATPLSVSDIALGEMLWASTKGLLSGAVTLVVAASLGLVGSPWVILTLVVAAFQGVAFGGISLAFASRWRTIDAINHLYALFMAPVFFLSGVFFPLEHLPAWARTAAWFSPLTHTATIGRALADGDPSLGLLVSFTWVVIWAGVGIVVGTWSLRRRMWV